MQKDYAIAFRPYDVSISVREMWVYALTELL